MSYSFMLAEGGRIGNSNKSNILLWNYRVDYFDYIVQVEWMWKGIDFFHKGMMDK